MEPIGPGADEPEWEADAREPDARKADEPEPLLSRSQRVDGDPEPPIDWAALDPVVVPREDHGISRKNIDRDALNALYRLIEQGHTAYLVGGAVRDLMIGKAPKDFDIVTDATPRKVKRIFRNCRVIGRRFKLAHLHYSGGKILEVATFRSSGEADEVVREGEMIRRDNVYGTPAEDAYRRDLTINALFYDVKKFTVIDFVGGVDDLRASVVRMVGDPDRSFHEDPVRMLRAIRHAGRTGFHFAPETSKAMERCRHQILKANPARLLEEFYKDLGSGHARDYFVTLHELGFLELLMPVITEQIEDPGVHDRWGEALGRLDQRVREGKRVHQALGIAALIAPELLARLESLLQGPERRSGHLPRKIRDGVTAVLRQLKVYRRDGDRLWDGLRGLSAVQKCVEEGKWSSELEGNAWARDSIEILYILLGPGEGRSERLEEAESFPEVPVSQPRGRRRRPGGGAGQQGAGPAESAVPDEERESPRKRPKRRRRRSKRSPGTSKQ
ncbi:MAG: polynucleotide adenylyltransferase PcnB [Planctomycetota bacterium]|nr:polynucleotide adenylyltransferase PcnB [Planctomycetota bacterium]